MGGSYLIYSVYSTFNSLESTFEPVANTHSISFPSLKAEIKIETLSWGLSGNHNRIIISEDSSTSTFQYTFYTSELFYKKIGEDSLRIFVPSSCIHAIPDHISQTVKIDLVELRNFDEIQQIESTYQKNGLTKIITYQ